MDRLTLRQIAVPALYIFLSGVIVVFAHSGLQGSHGLAALHEAREEERKLTLELARIRAENDRLENKVERLSDRGLDLDLLDERARAVLGMARPDEIIVR